MSTLNASPSTPLSQDKPLSIAILAMGGQGGGVLADWVVALAETNGWVAQTTSVPGVAQRTGATIYYLELLRAREGAHPILSLMPTPGDVDIVIAAELMEAGRSVLRGLVTPDKTLLITSTHRSFAVGEKEKPGDGTGNPVVVEDATAFAARKTIAFDMEALATKSGSVVSSARLRLPALCLSTRPPSKRPSSLAARASRQASGLLKLPISARLAARMTSLRQRPQSGSTLCLNGPIIRHLTGLSSAFAANSRVNVIRCFLRASRN